MIEASIVIPNYMPFGAKKPVNCLNLNWYRNAHFRALAKAKIMYDELIGDKVEYELPIFSGKVRVDMVYFLRSRRGVDIANMDSIVRKFFLDILVSRMRIVDDNFNFQPTGLYDFGGIDKNNPRCEVRIYEVE